MTRLQYKKVQQKNLLKNMPDGFAYFQVVTDKMGNPVDYICLQINPAFTKLTGLSKEMVIGIKVSESYPEVEKLDIDWLMIYNQLLASEKPVQFESYFELFKKWLEVTAYRDETEYVAIIFKDITERKKTEANLLAEKNEKDTIINNLSEQIAFIDPEMRIIWANSKTIERHKLDEHDYKGQICYEAYHQLNTPCPDCPVVEAFKTGNTNQSVHKSTENKYWQVTSVPVRNHLETIIGVLYTALNITEEVKIEAALRESEERLDLAMTVKNEGIWDWNLVTNETIFDDRYYTMAGYQPGDFPQTFDGWAERVHKDDLPAAQQEIEKYLTGKSDIYDVEFRFQKKDGQWMWINGKGLVFGRDAAGTPLRMVGTHTDITERKIAEEKIQTLNRELEKRVKERTIQLEAANRELEAFSYSASHDLRGPLNRISGFSEALLEDYQDSLDSLGKDYLQRIKGSCDHMKLLIDDFLKLSRVSQQQISREPVEMTRLANDYLKELQNKDSQRTVDIDIHPNMDVEGDPTLIQIALQNLFDNAWKYTIGTDKARIEFGSTVHGKTKIYYIRDNGAGFDMKHSEKLFTAFQRLHDPKIYPGTGIGLSIVSRIITRHGGELWAEGEPGKGACFYFTLSKINHEKVHKASREVLVNEQQF